MSEINQNPADSTEIVIEEKQRVNGTGLTSLVIVILSFIAPIVVVIVGYNLARDSATTGGVVIGTVFAIVAAAIVAVSLDVIGIVVGIVSLFRQNRGKLLGLIAIFLGLIPIVVVVLGATVFSSAIQNGIGG